MTSPVSPTYEQLKIQLDQAALAITPSELHGLLTGLLVAGLDWKSKDWQPLLFDYTNQGMGWPTALLQLTQSLFNATHLELTQPHFIFSFILPEPVADETHAFYQRAEGLAEWVSHFISGLGLAGAAVNKCSLEAKESLQDLDEISRLGVDEEESIAQQSQFLEQVLEHCKVCILTLYTEWGISSANTTNTYH